VKAILVEKDDQMFFSTSKELLTFYNLLICEKDANHVSLFLISDIQLCMEAYACILCGGLDNNG
jgi:hypothetical protein